MLGTQELLTRIAARNSVFGSRSGHVRVNVFAGRWPFDPNNRIILLFIAGLKGSNHAKCAQRQDKGISKRSGISPRYSVFRVNRQPRRASQQVGRCVCRGKLDPIIDPI